MKILIVGAGFTGCSLARLLKERNHNIEIIEKEDHIGGLCYTTISPNYISFEPYGAHTFHTKNKEIQSFIQRFAKLNNYIHYKGILINNKLWQYPLSIQTIKRMPESKEILKELLERPKKPNFKNCETYMISIFGKTLYKLFVYNYSKKMWGQEPKNLTASWVLNRIDLRETNSNIFQNQWQGVPIEGYTKMFENMILGIQTRYNYDKFNRKDYDLILFSGKIDQLLNYEFGVLPYMSMRFDYIIDESWENDNYGTINLPQHSKYIRKVNFKIIHQQKVNHSYLQYQEPINLNENLIPMYPIYSKKNLLLFDKYLREVCKSERTIPVGRLGLYKYLDMDKAVSLAIDMIPLIENWKNLKPKKRYVNLVDLLNNY